MARLTEHRNSEGKLTSFTIRVYRGRDAEGRELKPWSTSFKCEPTWKEASARKKAEAFAANFERDCKNGLSSGSRQTFQEFCEYCIRLKENNGVKHSTIQRYRELTRRIYPAIGYMKITDIRASHLNELYHSLSADGLNEKTGGKLSPKTILEHHRLISTVLNQAVKESLIPFNPAERTEKPKVQKKEVNYFQPEQIAAIREALENEPFDWQVLVHMFIVTGARRGEILGLKWSCVDWDSNRIHIENNIQYSQDRGIYEETPKTARSIRWISLPRETMQLLHEYKMGQIKKRFSAGTSWQDNGFIFTQADGRAMHPDSVTTYLTRFSKKYNLPHINAHAFRHTMASILYHSGMDTISISARLGHAQPSTTANIYAHVIDEADRENADAIAAALLKKA